MKFTRKISFKAGLTAAQVSEFGFVFLFIVEQQGYMNGNMIPLFTFIALTTIFISSYLIMYNGQIWKMVEPLFRFFGKDKYVVPANKLQKYDVLVFGYHRLGWKVCEALEEMGMTYAVIDFDPLAINKLEERSIPHFYGDATDVEFLSELPLEKIKVLISTLPSTSSQLTMIKYVRENYPKPVIIATMSYSRFLHEMYEAGADYVMMPHLMAGEWIADVIRKKKYNRRSMNKMATLQKDQMKLKYTLPKEE